MSAPTTSPYYAGEPQAGPSSSADINTVDRNGMLTSSITSMASSMTTASIRQVTPPIAEVAFDPQSHHHHHHAQQQPQQMMIVDFDHNADYPSPGTPVYHPPRYEAWDPLPCDTLKQRVWDACAGQFYKAACLLLNDRAYWLQQPVRKAMFGTVWIGQELQRPFAYGVDPSVTHWETFVPNKLVAIKQASRQLLQRAELLNSAEHPRREHAAMQHLYYRTTAGVGGGPFAAAETTTPAAVMERTGIIMPQDWCDDEHYCYLITPYCNGGELFDRVGAMGRFTEDEARHWMHQILNSLETLHTAGVTHRDLSLENIMIHNDRAVIIDLGMSLLIPHDPQTKQRCLIAPQGAAGKLKYMAPEVYNSGSPNRQGAAEEGFDGKAVDLWAVGVILFIMLTGEVPWQLPDPTDLKFQKFTDGWIEPYLKGQGYPLSANAYCLLQRMLWLNPRDRLCSHQVRAHPWMMTSSGGGLIRFRSANRDGKKNRDDDDDGERESRAGNDGDDDGGDQKETTTNKVLTTPPGEIKSGRYSQDDNVTPEDMTVMLETVEKYRRDEPRPQEEISTVEPTVLSDNDSYVKALREKKLLRVMPKAAE